MLVCNYPIHGYRFGCIVVMGVAPQKKVEGTLLLPPLPPLPLEVGPLNPATGHGGALLNLVRLALKSDIWW